MISPSIAVVFPGQGSQSLHMLQEFYRDFPDVKDLFSEASSVLEYDLWKLISEGPEQSLNQTEKTQPALLVAGYAVWKVLKSKLQIQPMFLAGHSLGEYTALVAAEVIPFDKAVDIVAKRGRFMQEAVPEGQGAMAAIVGFDDDIVTKMCAKVSTPDAFVAPANFNAIGQVVVAGDRTAVLNVIELAHAQGAKLAKEISVSVPCHCQLMIPAAKRLADELAKVEFSTPKYPVIHNVDVACRQNIDAIKHALVEQLSQPVRWVEIIQHMRKSGVTTLIEAGPNRVLTGLAKRIDRSLKAFSVNDLETLQHVTEELQECCA